MRCRKNRFRAAIPLVVTAIALFAGSTLPGRAEPDPLAGFQAWLDGTRDLRARFEQQLVSGALGGGEIESGRLVLSRPGRMRWEYDRPERKVALIDGERTSLYVAADRQLWLGRLEADDRLLPTLLAAEHPLDELFVISRAEPDPSGEPRLRLVPRERAHGVSELVLSLTPGEFAIAGADVRDASGNRVRYRFSRLRRNRGVEPRAFEFEPPAGTDVIGNP